MDKISPYIPIVLGPIVSATGVVMLFHGHSLVRYLASVGLSACGCFLVYLGIKLKNLLSQQMRRDTLPSKSEYLTGPNGEHLLKTSRHLVGTAPDGAPNCDRCKNGKLLSCMDSCECRRMG